MPTVDIYVAPKGTPHDSTEWVNLGQMSTTTPVERHPSFEEGVKHMIRGMDGIILINDAQFHTHDAEVRLEEVHDKQPPPDPHKTRTGFTKTPRHKRVQRQHAKRQQAKASRKRNRK